MRRTLKFLHSMGAIGFLGGIACLIVLATGAPPSTSLASYAATLGAMDAISTYILLPSLGLTLVAGLLAIGLNRGYHNAGWAWVKLATGVLVFEGSLVGIIGPLGREAERSAGALGGRVDPATLVASLATERNVLWVMFAIATANVILGIWRPRLTRLPD